MLSRTYRCTSMAGACTGAAVRDASAAGAAVPLGAGCGSAELAKPLQRGEGGTGAQGSSAIGVRRRGEKACRRACKGGGGSARAWRASEGAPNRGAMVARLFRCRGGVVGARRDARGRPAKGPKGAAQTAAATRSLLPGSGRWHCLPHLLGAHGDSMGAERVDRGRRLLRDRVWLLTRVRAPQAAAGRAEASRPPVGASRVTVCIQACAEASSRV